MATIKSYTDLEQSKKLAEILPLESADMCYQVGEDLDGYLTQTIYTPLMHTPYNDDYIPCWSLASLLKIIGHYTLQTVSKDKKVFIVSEENYPICSDTYSETIDACYELILKLHELNLL